MTAHVETHQRHRRSNPCPVCGGFDELPRGHKRRCAGFTNGDWCRCTREEHAGALPPEDLDGGTVYRHLLKGECRCGLTHNPAPFVDHGYTGPKEIEATYDYRDESGELLFQVVRFVGKDFRQRRPDTNGKDGWAWKLGDVRRVPYRLPELLSAPALAPVYIVEGEKDANTLARHGCVATCNPGGSGKWHFVEATAAKVLSKRDVIIIADADDVGRKHANEVASHVRKVARSVELLEPPGPHKDVTDLFNVGGTLSTLVAMKAPTPKVVPNAPEPPAWEEEPADPDEARRPTIMMGHRIDLVVEALERHMATLDPGLYKRSHEIVTVNASDGLSLAEGTPIIRAVTASALLPRVTRHVQFLVAQEDDKPPKKVRPPDTILKTILAAPPWPTMRHLAGVSESPFFRPRGTVCQSAGYDAETGYLYAPPCAYPEVPDHPTQAEARAWQAEILDYFCDFPYVNEQSRMVPLAAIYAILARPAIDGPVPALLFDASVMGSGKTLQCDVAHAIAVGRIPAHANWPSNPEEQEKLLHTYALSSPSALVLDNVKGVFGGSAIEQTLTSTSVEFRLLGAHEMKTLSWRSVVIVSGNNVALTEDMVRRTLLSRLESPLDRPQDRTDFKYELPKAATDARARLCALALGVLRAYAAKGFPDTGVRMASYQSFARIVAGAILFAGGADVTRARPPEERAGLDGAGAARVIVDRCHTVSPAPQTFRAFLQAIYPPPARNEPPDGFDELREAVETLAPPKGSQAPSAHSFQRALAKFEGRLFGSKRLRMRTDPHDKVMRFWVE